MNCTQTLDPTGLEEIEEQINIAYPSIDDSRNRLLAWAMFNGYVLRWASENRSLEIIAVEKEFAGLIENPATRRTSRTFKMVGKGDLIVRDSLGRLWYVEHKTAAEITGGYIDRLALDLQIKLYLPYLSEAIGEKISGVIYDVIAKTRIRQKQNETVDDFQARLEEKYSDPETYYREKIFISDDDILETFRDIWIITQQVRQARASGIFIRNFTNCYTYNTPCAYFPICSVGRDAEQAVIENGYVFKRKNTELSRGKRRMLTYSAIRMFQSCPRKYDFRFNHEIVPAKRDEQAMYLGTVIHAALAAYYGNESVVSYFIKEA